MRGALLLLAVLAFQMIIGEIQYRTKLPCWWLRADPRDERGDRVGRDDGVRLFWLWRPLESGMEAELDGGRAPDHEPAGA